MIFFSSALLHMCRRCAWFNDSRPAGVSGVSHRCSAKGRARPTLTQSDWEDLVPYLHSAQVFQFPADTGRRQEIFRSQKYAGATLSLNQAVDPDRLVSDWKRADDPAPLVYQMWHPA